MIGNKEGAMLKLTHLSIVAPFLISLGVGCSSYSKTVRTETMQYPAESVQPVVTQADERPKEAVVVEKKKEETTTETKGESTGLLSGAVHVVGETLALPFRAVGGLLGVIF